MGRKLALFFDGTWNKPGRDARTEAVETSVRRLYEATPNTPAQTTWYDSGVGTGRLLDKLLGGAFGVGLDGNICEGYRQLCASYREGDELFLFGFSRGAYTARSLAGMLNKCGLLHAPEHALIDKAYAFYRDTTMKPAGPEARAFRAAHSREIRVRCIAVWDTVGALGIPLDVMDAFNLRRHAFHDTELSSIVEHAYHACAIDEARDIYDVALWTHQPRANQVVEQRWFPGAHADVGGGYRERDLSYGPLRWLASKVQALGLAFDASLQLGAPPQDAVAGLLHNELDNPLFDLVCRMQPRRLGLGQFGVDSNQTLSDEALARYRQRADYRPCNWPPGAG